MSTQNDFDFLQGRWKVSNRMLRKRLDNSDDWIEFDGVLEVRPILDGLGNVDEFRAEIEGRTLIGTTLRIFSPTSQLWSLYWVDSWSGELQPAPRGLFEDGIGEFYCDDVYRHHSVRCRFLWKDISRDSACWEQAYSADNEKTWETNWIMKFEREELNSE